MSYLVIIKANNQQHKGATEIFGLIKNYYITDFYIKLTTQRFLTVGTSESLMEHCWKSKLNITKEQIADSEIYMT